MLFRQVPLQNRNEFRQIRAGEKILRTILIPATGVRGFSFRQECLDITGESSPNRLAKNAVEGIPEEPVNSSPHFLLCTSDGEEGKSEGDLIKVIRS
jgi:hypothetical protein